MKKLLFFGILSCLFFSCGVDVDRSKIIGKSTSTKPYGDYGMYGYVYLNGVEYTANAVYYRNRALVYVMNKEGYYIDYYFTKFIDYDEAKNIPLGTDMDDIIKKFGVPAFINYIPDEEASSSSMPEGRIPRKAFSYEYVQKTRKSNTIFYKIFSSTVLLYFDSNKKLVSIESSYHSE